jgi:hypothetical protein
LSCFENNDYKLSPPVLALKSTISPVNTEKEDINGEKEEMGDEEVDNVPGERDARTSGSVKDRRIKKRQRRKVGE